MVSLASVGAKKAVLRLSLYLSWGPRVNRWALVGTEEDKVVKVVI